MKKCCNKNCKRPWKDESEFGKDKNKIDGLNVTCKECVHEQYEKNREYKIQYQRDYRKNNKEKVAASNRKYEKENAVKISIRKKEYEETHKDKLKIKRRDYNKSRREINNERSNKEYKTVKGKYRSYKSKAKRRGHEFKLSFDEFKSFWQCDCSYCNSKIETIGIDRINNLGYIFENCCSCCTTCNILKWKLNEIEWENYLKKLIIFRTNGCKQEIINQNIENKEQERNVLRMYKQYKRGADIRNLPYLLSIEQFSLFFKIPCTYCGEKIDIVKLDRINNKNGYEIDNVCSCCHNCNRGKLNLEYYKWIKYLNNLVLFQLKKNLNYYKTIIDIEKINNFINKMEEVNV